MTYPFLRIATATVAVAGGVSYFWPPFAWSGVVIVPLIALGLADYLQRRHAVRRNFPIIGNLRYLFEAIRPEIAQYFIESNTDGTPFSREQRSIVYQRSKKELQTLPFGTQHDVYEVGAEWINHSMHAKPPLREAPRIRIGGPGTTRPYAAALLNISAMSFGALSKNAVRALNLGAKEGGFYHNTGEGGLSPYHLENGGDVCWQIGTGYFGCRRIDGGFDPKSFEENARRDQVKLIEIKLSQGAKPGHGGILPAAKVTQEIASIRGVAMGADVISPPAHTAFTGPRTLLEFCAELRERSGGKPVGFKLCVGHRAEFLSIVRAMHETDLLPDFVTIDGGEGGTGAAPLEFSNFVGWPLTEGLRFAHNALVGFGLRDRLKVVAAGKIVTGFDMLRRMALGADVLCAARAMMFALGCIQARRCHSNDCPVGVATQKPTLTRGLVVADKAPRVASFQRETVHAFLELIGAAGADSPGEIQLAHVFRRVAANQIKSYAELYEALEPGILLEDPPPTWKRFLEQTDLERFSRIPDLPIAPA